MRYLYDDKGSETRDILGNAILAEIEFLKSLLPDTSQTESEKNDNLPE